MRKTLLVGGDSFSDQNCDSYKGSDIVTWPILLAEKLDMNLVCVAQSGGGNEQIYSSILDWISENGSDNVGMVIAGWSKSERMDYELTRDHCAKYWHNVRVSPRGGIHGWIRKSMRNFYNLQLLCEFHNIPYKQFQMISLFTEYVSEYCQNDFENKRLSCVNTMIESSQFDLINKENFIGWPIFNEDEGFVVGDVTVHQGWKDYNKLANNNPNSLYYNSAKDMAINYVVSAKDCHPNKAGHKKIMEFIYENL